MLRPSVALLDKLQQLVHNLLGIAANYRASECLRFTNGTWTVPVYKVAELSKMPGIVGYRQDDMLYAQNQDVCCMPRIQLCVMQKRIAATLTSDSCHLEHRRAG